MKIKNQTTGQTVTVSNTYYRDGQIFGRYQFGARYYNKYGSMLTKIGDTEDGSQPILTLKEGWEIDEPEKKERQPRKQRQPQTEVHEEPQPEPQAAPVEDEPQSEPVEEVQPQPQTTEDDNERALIAALKGLRGGNVDEDRVRAIIKDELSKVQPQHVQHVIKVNELPEVTFPEGEEAHPMLEMLIKRVVNDRALGRFPWLYGPAGSGKSTLAAQVAKALSLPFYSVSSLQQKYELEGYTDAVGEFVQTAFYKAMSEGGVFCFDEMSTTSGEVQVAFNTAAAQLLYNFPKVGMIKAHPDFHIIACDNTTGRGGDSRYTSRYQLDSSTLDRYTFIEVGYTDAHDLRMAQGDRELVDFMRSLRDVLEQSDTTYLATPRASKSIKGEQALGSDDAEALWYGLASGWNKQDVRTFAASLRGSGRYFDAFREMATRYCNA